MIAWLLACSQPVDRAEVDRTLAQVDPSRPADGVDTLVAGMQKAGLYGQAECSEMVSHFLASTVSERDSVALDAIDACSMRCPPAGAFEVTQGLGSLDPSERVAFIANVCAERGEPDRVFTAEQRRSVALGDYVLVRFTYDALRDR